MYSGIKGYEKLTEGAKGVFNYVYKKHHNGVEDKEDWTAVEIKQRRTYLEVKFKNCKWLAYFADGSWS